MSGEGSIRGGAGEPNIIARSAENLRRRHALGPPIDSSRSIPSNLRSEGFAWASDAKRCASSRRAVAVATAKLESEVYPQASVLRKQLLNRALEIPNIDLPQYALFVDKEG